MARFNFMSAILLSSTFLFSMCIQPDKEEVELVNPATSEDLVIDESYHASLSFLQKTWTGTYSGYDENQKANTNIRRKLVLKTDGTYENTIEGILVSKTENKSEYTAFEKEKGRYVYNGTNMITFYVAEDSLINYQTEVLEYFSKKHSRAGGSDTSNDLSNYTEDVQFNYKDNEYRWVTKDVYLSNIDNNAENKNKDLRFLMTVKTGQD